MYFVIIILTFFNYGKKVLNERLDKVKNKLYTNLSDMQECRMRRFHQIGFQENRLNIIVLFTLKV